MGSEIPFASGMHLEAAAPLAGEFRVLRQGQEVARARGRSLRYAVAGPGIYRVEVWLQIAGESKLWILSNPIYVRN